MHRKKFESIKFIDQEKFDRLLGDRIREVREEAHCTQELLADISDLHVNTIKLVESGNTTAKVYTIYKIAVALEKPIGELLDI